MTIAPHTNTDVHRQLIAGIAAPLPLIFGAFKVMETGAEFEYSERRHHDDSFAPEMPHSVYMSDGSTRLALVRKTVAYVVTDEDADGLPVVEKWAIKSRAFDTEWVGRS